MFDKIDYRYISLPTNIVSITYIPYVILRFQSMYNSTLSSFDNLKHLMGIGFHSVPN